MRIRVSFILGLVEPPERITKTLSILMVLAGGLEEARGFLMRMLIETDAIHGCLLMASYNLEYVALQGNNLIAP